LVGSVDTFVESFVEKRDGARVVVSLVPGQISIHKSVLAIEEPALSSIGPRAGLFSSSWLSSRRTGPTATVSAKHTRTSSTKYSPQRASSSASGAIPTDSMPRPAPANFRLHAGVGPV